MCNKREEHSKFHQTAHKDIIYIDTFKWHIHINIYGLRHSADLIKYRQTQEYTRWTISYRPYEIWILFKTQYVYV